MGRELGRISGPLLAENLLRNGNNLAFETDLLYLDVVTGKVGIKIVNPTRDLLINGTVNVPNLIVDSYAEIGQLEFSSSQIQTVTGSTINIEPNPLLDPTVEVPKITVSNVDLEYNTITNTTSGNNLVLHADGTGKVVFTTTTVTINANLHATGNITWAGSTITLGSDSNDSVTFDADLSSNLLPDVNNFSDLGSPSKEWRNLRTHNLKVTNIVTADSVINDIDLLLTQGQTIYVSVNGNDTYAGNLLNSTYRTIKKALSVAQSGDQVVIFPGEYEEIFPLTVPQGVSVNGTGIRSVNIYPTAGTNTNNAFLLNGETTVSNLTVKNFYTGYAFSFAPGVKITSRSPYVYNVTVITSGTNAGNGAIADGSLADPTSNQASLLFFSATFIVPNAIGIAATNGSRVEWLNSFTYFAEKGIYLTEGTLGFASLGVTFGTEMRSINSANVYGTYGAVADGPNTLGYLIGHNFGYIGSGTDGQNDYGLIIQANEIVAINGGQLYYDSVDQKGDYRIGDIFHVVQQTGQIEFNAQSISFNANGDITLESSEGRTYINYAGISVDNIYIHGNNIDSLAGPITLSAANNTINLNDNIADTVYITGNLDVTGGVTIAGTLVTLGDTITDTVTIVDYFTQDINPKTTASYALGSATSIWNNGYFSGELDVDGRVQILNNTITALTSENLQLTAAGTGKILIQSNDLEIDNSLVIFQNLTVSGTTNLKNTQVDNVIQQGSIDQQSGNTDITGNVSGVDIAIIGPTSILELPSITIDGNTISGTATNTTVDIQANGTGQVYIPYNNVLIDQNLTVGGTLNQTQPTEFGNLTVVGTITQLGNYNSLVTGDYTLSGTVNSSSITLTDPLGALTLPAVTISGNTIAGTDSNTSLVIQANGTGKILVNQTDVSLGQNATVGGTLSVGQTASFGNVTTTDTVTLTGNINQTGNTTVTGNLDAASLTGVGTGYLDVGNFRIQGQTIEGLVTNGNVTFDGFGAGIVKVGPTIIFSGTDIIATVAENYTTEDGEVFVSEDNEEFVTEGNNSNLDIEFAPNNGNFVIDSTSFLQIPSSSNSFHVLGTDGEIRLNTDYYDIQGRSGTGNVWLTKVYSQDRLSGVYENSNTLNFFTDNGTTIQSYIDENKWKSNNQLELANINITGATISNVNSSNDINLDVSGTGAVMFNDIEINTTIPTPSSSALILSSTGTGYIKFAGTNGVVLGVGTTLDYPSTPEVGTVRYNTELNYPEVYDAVQGWIPFSGQPITENELIDINDLWALILG